MLEELVQMLESYVDGALSLDDFECALYSSAYNIENRNVGPAMAFAHLVEGILAESSSGHWPEDALRRKLDSVLDGYRPNQSVWSFNAPSHQFQVMGRSSAVLMGFPRALQRA